jgi:hypothetical protein
MKPTLSLINSASATGLSATKELVDKLGLKYIDLYAFMQEDLQLLWPDSIMPDAYPRSALYEMAKAYENPADLARIIKIIEDKTAPARVASIATYLPEITNSKLSGAVQKAIKFTIQLADALQRRDHPAKTIEISGGSIVDGLWRELRQKFCYP